MVLGVPRREAADPRRIYVRDEQGRVASGSFHLAGQRVARRRRCRSTSSSRHRCCRPRCARACRGRRELRRCSARPRRAARRVRLACHREGDAVPRRAAPLPAPGLRPARRGAPRRRAAQPERAAPALRSAHRPPEPALARAADRRARCSGAAARRSFLGLARVAIDGLDRVRATFGPATSRGSCAASATASARTAARARCASRAASSASSPRRGRSRSCTRRLRSGCDAVRTTLAGEERAAYLHTRAGAAVWPQDASDAAGLLGCADAALRHAAPGSAGSSSTRAR